MPKPDIGRSRQIHGDLSIKDKVIAITGSGSGIGRATALHLAQQGGQIVLAARREAQIAAVAADIQAAGGHVINVVSTAGLKILPTMGVYAATKNAVRTITEALRQEAGPTLRVTEVSPGFVATNFADPMTDEAMKRTIQERSDALAISSDAIARGIAFAIEQPSDVDVGSIVIRPTAQD